jgi:transposase
MIWNGRRVTAYAYTAPVDMRKGFDGLMAVVEQKLGRNPLSGELFLFVSRNLIRAKVLF